METARNHMMLVHLFKKQQTTQNEMDAMEARKTKMVKFIIERLADNCCYCQYGPPGLYEFPRDCISKHIFDVFVCDPVTGMFALRLKLTAFKRIRDDQSTFPSLEETRELLRDDKLSMYSWNAPPEFDPFDMKHYYSWIEEGGYDEDEHAHWYRFTESEDVTLEDFMRMYPKSISLLS